MNTRTNACHWLDFTVPAENRFQPMCVKLTLDVECERESKQKKNLRNSLFCLLKFGRFYVVYSCFSVLPSSMRFIVYWWWLSCVAFLLSHWSATHANIQRQSENNGFKWPKTEEFPKVKLYCFNILLLISSMPTIHYSHKLLLAVNSSLLQHLFYVTTFDQLAAGARERERERENVWLGTHTHI